MSDLRHLWKVGQKVVWITSDFEGVSREQGTVTEVHENHVVCDIPTVSDHMMFEQGFNLDNLYPAYNFEV